jgi:hypothetical protein
LNTIVNRNIIFQILPYFSVVHSSTIGARVDPFKIAPGFSVEAEAPLGISIACACCSVIRTAG